MSKHCQAQHSACGEHSDPVVLCLAEATRSPKLSPPGPPRNAFLESFAALFGCWWNLGDTDGLSCVSLSTLSVEESYRVELVPTQGRRLRGAVSSLPWCLNLK